MKQDIRLFRKILAAIQSNKQTIMSHPDVPGYSEETISRHIELLHAAGYLDVSGAPTETSRGRKYLIRDLSVQGHEFVGMILNEPVWNEFITKFSDDELNKIPISDLYEACRRVSRNWMDRKIED